MHIISFKYRSEKIILYQYKLAFATHWKDCSEYGGVTLVYGKYVEVCTNVDLHTLFCVL